MAKAIISLENSPVSSPLSPTFQKYIEGMRAITDARLIKRKDADDILSKYEQVDT
jgi:hypothetical protein